MATGENPSWPQLATGNPPDDIEWKAPRGAMALTGRPWETTMDPNSTTMSGATTTVSPDASTHVVRSERAHQTEGGITLG